MKFEVEVKLVNGSVKSFITKDYETYNPVYKSVNGLYQVGFIKEGKTRFTWTPVKSETYSHNVEVIKVKEATTGRVIEVIQCER